MIQLKQRLFFQCKGLKQATFPQLMNADKERGDNQTKGIFLLLVSLWFVKCFRSSPWLVRSFNQRMPTNKWPSSAISLHPPLYPPCSPPAFNHSLSPLPHSLLVASRLAVTHLAPPEAHNRRLVCEEGQEFRLGWGSIPPSAQRRLPCGFIIICRWHSAQVQAQCKRWHQRGGMRLATHLVISCP